MRRLPLSGAGRRLVAGRRAAGTVAWLLWSYAVVGAIITVVLVAATPVAPSAGGSQTDLLNALVNVLLLSWATTGAVLITRRPRHPIGWLLLFVGLAGVTEAAGGAYARWARQAAGVQAVPTEYVALFADLFWLPTLVASATLVPLLFPEGRLPSRRWRPVLRLALFAAMAYVPATLLLPGELHYLPGEENPLGVAALGSFLEGVQAALTIMALLCSLVAIGGLAVRYRRATGTLRVQLRWFVAAFVALTASVPPAAIYDETALGSITFELFWALPPVAIGVAILRYRLYEIDRIISRTVGWTLLTGLLLASYFGLVVVLQRLLAPLAGESDLTVAGATLAVAALFTPLRRRVQHVVDRRFDRARYDAERTMAAFRARLRDEVDLHELRADLLATTRAAIRPEHVSVWLRGASEGA